MLRGNVQQGNGGAEEVTALRCRRRSAASCWWWGGASSDRQSPLSAGQVSHVVCDFSNWSLMPA